MAIKSNGSIKLRSVKANAIFNVILTVSNIIFPLVTFAYASRVLDAANLGKVSFFTNLTSFLIMLASLGISTYGIRATAKVRDDREELTATVWELMTINLLATLVVLLLLLFSCIIIDRLSTERILLAICILQISLAPIGMNWLFSGLEQYSYITIRSIIFKLLSLFLILILVRSEADYPLYSFFLACATVGSNICNYIYARKFLSRNHRSLRIKQHMKPALLLFASALAINVYTHLDTVMLGFIGGDAEVGYYTVAVYVKTALLTMINAISVVILPRMSYLIESDQNEAARRLLRKSFFVILIMAIPLTLYFIYESRNVILVLGGESFLPALTSMHVIMPVLIVSGISNVTGNQILIPNGRDGSFMKAVVSGAIVNLILNIILMPQWYCVGAAVATLVAEIVQMSIQFYYARKALIPVLNWKPIAKMLFASLVSLVALFAIDFFLAAVPAIMHIAITGLLYFPLYCVLLLLLREEVFCSILNESKARMLKRCRQGDDQ